MSETISILVETARQVFADARETRDRDFDRDAWARVLDSGRAAFFAILPAARSQLRTSVT